MEFEFSGTRAELEGYLLSISGRHYVYALCRPDETPFYIGKGRKRRAIEHELEADRHHPFGETNPFKCNVIRKLKRGGGSILYRIIASYGDGGEAACLAKEAELIARYKRLHEGGPLTNLAGGVGSAAGSSPFSLEKHSKTLAGEPENNPQRAILNLFLLGIGTVDSVPIKPVSQMNRILPSTPHPNPRRASARCAYALIASAIAHGMTLEAGMLIPRSFTYEGVEAIIENGVSRDILKAGMAKLIVASSPSDEMYEIDMGQVELLISIFGETACRDRGLI